MVNAKDIYARYFRADKLTSIGEAEGRKLYHIVMNGPGGEPMEFYAGEVYMSVNGRQILTPEEPQFCSESQAQAWLRGGKRE